MSHQLREALHDLADERVAARAPVDATDLWRRGRRARRNRRAATVAALVAVFAVLAGGVAWQPGLPSVAPAGTDGQVGVPDRVGVPRSWSRGTESLGPPGRLALIATGTRRTWPWGQVTAVFGVTAQGQDYRWLDLPGRTQRRGNPVALSPDGRKVAYFVSGRPTGPRTFTGIVGWAVWDAETGAVVRHRVKTAHGLRPESVTWSGDSQHVLVSYGQAMSPTASSDLAAYWWEPGSGDAPAEASPLAFLSKADFGFVPGPDGITTWSRGGFSTHVPGREAQRVVATERQLDLVTRKGVKPQFAVVSPGGDRIAWAVEFPYEDKQGAELVLFTASVSSSPGQPAGLRDVTVHSGRWSAWKIAGWLDDGRVLALGAGDRQRGLVAFDLEGGTPELAVDTRTGDGWWVEPQVAREVLLEGLVPGDPPIPLALLGWGLALVAGGLAVLAVLVRRARRGRLA